jgi:hypothetical protein
MFMALPGLPIKLNTAPVHPLLSQTILSKPVLATRSHYIWLSAHESPLHERLYAIWVAVMVEGSTGVIHRYDLSLLEPAGLSWCRRISRPYELSHDYRLQSNTTISYAGYAIVTSLRRDVSDAKILSLSCPTPTSRTKTPRITRIGQRVLRRKVKNQIPFNINQFSFFLRQETENSKQEPPGHVIPLPNFNYDTDTRMHLSTYSRTLTLHKDKSIVINYFE